MKPSESIFEAVGRFVIYVSYLEERIGAVYRRIYDREGVEFFPMLESKRKVRKINDSLCSSETYFLDVCAKTLLLLDKRNEIIHGQIYGEGMTKEMHLHTSRTKVSERIFSLEEIDALYCEINDMLADWMRMTTTKILLKS